MPITPAAVTNTFGNDSGSIALSDLDNNYDDIVDYLNSPINYSNYIADTGAVNAYVVTLNAGLTWAETAGVGLQVKISATNSGASTLAVNGGTAQAIKNQDGTALASGTLVAGGIYTFIFDGTNYQLLGQTTIPASSATVPRNYWNGIRGLVGAGSLALVRCQVADSTNSVLMTLTLSTSIKTFAAWAVGSSAGAKLSAAAVANNTWYYIYMIRRPDTGIVDYGFDVSSASPTLPANYTQYRRIGAFRTDGAAAGVPISFYGDEFYYTTPQLETTSANPGTALVVQTLAYVPPISYPTALLNITRIGGVFYAYLSSTDSADLAPSGNVSPLATMGNTTTGAQARVLVTGAQTINTRISSSGAGEQLGICTLGWIDPLGSRS